MRCCQFYNDRNELLHSLVLLLGYLWCCEYIQWNVFNKKPSQICKWGPFWKRFEITYINVKLMKNQRPVNNTFGVVSDEWSTVIERGAISCRCVVIIYMIVLWSHSLCSYNCIYAYDLLCSYLINNTCAISRISAITYHMTKKQWCSCL
jgi:hypothetical protein